MFVDIENPIMFKLKQLDKEIIYYIRKKEEIDNLLKKIGERLIKHALILDKINNPENEKIIKEYKEQFENFIKKYNKIVDNFVRLCENNYILNEMLRAKKEEIVYNICKQIKSISDKVDENMVVNIFSSYTFKKNNNEIRISEICDYFGFKHHLVYGFTDAVDNKIIYELRKYIKENYFRFKYISVNLLTSDRALIVYSTYKYINKMHIYFNILIQDKCCSKYLLSSIRYYNNINKYTKLENIKIYNIDYNNGIYLNIDKNDKSIAYYPKNNYNLNLSWIPWIPGTEEKKLNQKEWK